MSFLNNLKIVWKVALIVAGVGGARAYVATPNSYFSVRLLGDLASNFNVRRFQCPLLGLCVGRSIGAAVMSFLNNLKIVWKVALIVAGRGVWFLYNTVTAAAKRGE